MVPPEEMSLLAGLKTEAPTNRELSQWHLRLQEVIMLQEKVANVAHGWLLKEEGGVGVSGGAASFATAFATPCS